MAAGGDRFGAYTLVRYIEKRGARELWSARGDDGSSATIELAAIGHRAEPAIKARLGQRLEVAMQVQHANIVRVLGSGFAGGLRFIVTEPIEGVALSDVLEAARAEAWWPAPGACAYVVHEVARALQYLHGLADSTGRPLGLVHRDIAPRNIFVLRSGAIKLSPFAGGTEPQELIDTAGREERGLVSYLSPELASDGLVDSRSDVFELGAVFWELLTRRPPFRGSNDLETLEAVRTASVPSGPSDCPADLAELARACLARDPERRPPIQELVAALSAAIRDDAQATSASARALFDRVAPPSPGSSARALSKTAPSQPTLASGSTRPSAPPAWARGAEETTAAGGASLSPAPSDPPRRSHHPSDPFYDAGRDGPAWQGGRFEVLGQLGSGGMGQVYRVRDRELEESVALKIIPPESTAQQRSLERLKREVRLARKIASPNVCRIYDLVDLGNGVRGLTMALIDGITLSELMKGGVAVDYNRFAAWGADLADGLAAAHELSIIHRDLKPENIMIRSDDRAVILDFGIAHSAEPATPESMKLTQVGMIMGTPLYMSPEQLLNLPLDGRSDLFALGLIVAELVTGEVPMHGTSYPELLEKRATKVERYHLREVDPGAPEDLASAIDDLLEPATADRPGSAQVIARRLRAFAEGAPRPDPVAQSAAGGYGRGSGTKAAGSDPPGLPRSAAAASGPSDPGSRADAGALDEARTPAAGLTPGLGASDRFEPTPAVSPARRLLPLGLVALFALALAIWFVEHRSTIGRDARPGASMTGSTASSALDAAGFESAARAPAPPANTAASDAGPDRTATGVAGADAALDSTGAARDAGLSRRDSGARTTIPLPPAEQM